MNELEAVALRAGSSSQVFSLTAARDLTGLQVLLTHYHCICDCNYSFILRVHLNKRSHCFARSL